ncbi:MAG TPA: M42 family metallopeptidase [Firmicutes bacterium]|nr:M42 family metallopeptidase [Bacillota bacterium]
MLLEELASCHGVSGSEGEVRELLRCRLAPHVDAWETDALGNLIALKRGSAGDRPRVMLVAHQDEVGLIVTKIEKDGRLRFRAVGGVDQRVLPARAVEVGPRRVPGVIGSKPVHLQEPEERKRPFRMSELYIDVGAANETEARELVALGDPVAFATRPLPFGEGRLKGKAFDDRAGCAVVAELLQDRYPFPVYGVFTVQEEVGRRGAGVAAYRLQPDLALAFEGTTASDVPGSPPHLHSTVVGQGPAITVMDASLAVRPWLVERLRKVAAERGIPYQLRRLNTGSTDAGQIAMTGAGVAAVTISVPTRYIHSPVTELDPADLAKAVELARAFLANLAEEGMPQ